MSKEDMVKAREFIRQKRFDDARAILRKTSHPQASVWLAKLDQLDPPPAADPEATLIENTPPPAEAAPPTTAPVGYQRQANKEERNIPMPLAIGCIGLVIVVGVCVIGSILVYSNIRDFVLSVPDTYQGPNPLDVPEIEGSNVISFGNPVSGVLSAGNDYDESWSFEAAQGDQVVITMRSSEIDSFLYLYSAGGNLLAQDDDSGGGVNGYDSEINYTIPEDGQYIIVANQWFEGQDGSYTLTLERE